MSTVDDPSMTTPSPWGGEGTGQKCWSAIPNSATSASKAFLAAWRRFCLVASKAAAAGSPDAKAALIAAETAAIAAFRATVLATNFVPCGIPRQAGRKPINTLRLPGPGESSAPWAVISPRHAAGRPVLTLYGVDVCAGSACGFGRNGLGIRSEKLPLHNPCHLFSFRPWRPGVR